MFNIYQKKKKKKNSANKIVTKGLMEALCQRPISVVVTKLSLESPYSKHPSHCLYQAHPTSQIPL